MTMVNAPPKLLTIEDYIAYDDGTERRYELVDGELVVMPTESQVNSCIARYLLFEFAKYFPIYRLAYKDIEIETPGKRARCRLPDLLIHSQESYLAIASVNRAIIRLDMPPPDLVVEVVSPGKENTDRDYRYKHTEYAARAIPEYWIIDPQLQQITVCQWIDGKYEDKIYQDENPIGSFVIPDFNLSALQILAFGEERQTFSS